MLATGTAVNPQTWDDDDSQPDPDRNAWSKIDLAITRGDGGWRFNF